MSYTDFDFPHSHMYESDLRELIAKMRKLEEIVKNFVNLEQLKFAEPITWNITTQYQKGTIVIDAQGNAYISKEIVPMGVQLDNTDYWLEIFNFTEYIKIANKNLTNNTEENTTRATDNYEVDDWLLWDNILYRVTTEILIDDILEVGTNLEHFTVEEFIKAFMTWAITTIQQYKDDVDASELAYQAAMQAEVDRILAGATVDSEVIDARLGANGINYSTLGNAIRGQFTDTTKEIHDIVSSGNYIDLSGVTLTEGKYLDRYNEEQSNGSMSYTDYIEIPKDTRSISINRAIKQLNGDISLQTIGVFWYDNNKNFISTGSSNITSGDILTSSIPNNLDVKYIRINISRYYYTPFALINYDNPLRFLGYNGTSNVDDYTSTGIIALYNPHLVSGLPVPVNNTNKGILIVDTDPNRSFTTQILVLFNRGMFTRVKTTEWSNWVASDGATYAKVSSLGIDDLDDLEYNKIYLIPDDENIAHLPYINFHGMILTFSHIASFESGVFQIALSNTNRMLSRFTWGGSATWSDWYEMVTPDNINKCLGLIATSHIEFTSNGQQINTGISLDANGKYIIKIIGTHSANINIFGAGNTNNYKIFGAPYEHVTFENDSTVRNLIVYNSGNSRDSFDIYIYTPTSPLLKTSEVERVYTVSKTDKYSDYTSVTKCLYDLKDDNTPKKIIIDAGEYDIYDEYLELYNAGLLDIYTGDNPSTDYFDYCVWVPDNTKIIGQGIVKFTWSPDPSTDDITPNQCRCISPLNVAGNCYIENIELHCKNGRYCLHNDSLGKYRFFGAKQVYKNIRFFKYDNDTDPVSGLTYGYNPTTGFGIDSRQCHVYEECVFNNDANSRAFYGHLRTNSGWSKFQSPEIILNNCVFNGDNVNDTIKLGSSKSTRNIQIKTYFNNCYINGRINCVLESSDVTECYNSYDLQFLGCGTVNVHINDSSNPYTPTGYNTTVNIV